MAKKDILECAIEKSLVEAQLTLEEVQALHAIDMGALIVEFDMSFNDATLVIKHTMLENQRLRAQNLYAEYDIAGRQVPRELQYSGEAPGTGYPPIKESRYSLKRLLNVNTKRRKH
jgi:hypothetical protein